MRIYVDFDDVLCETARHLADVARERFGRGVPYEAIETFNLQEAFSLSPQEGGELMRLAHRTDVLEAMAPTPGGVEGVRGLEAEGHEVVIVTGRPAYSHEGSAAWLARHGLGHLPLVHLDKFGRFPPSPPPAPRTWTREEFAGCHFDVAIDDSPLALDFLAPRGECLIVIFDRPWNRRYTAGANMRRGRTWEDVMALVAKSGK